MSRSEIVASRHVADDGSLVEVVVGEEGSRTVVTPSDEAIEQLKARQAEIRERLDALVAAHPELKAAR